MKSSLCIAALIFFALPALSRDHAPTVQQCSADYSLWMSQITEYDEAESARLDNQTKDNSVVMRMNMRALGKRAEEMSQCAVVDSNTAPDYHYLAFEYLSARTDRYQFYVERHGLEFLMFKEDLAGKRN